MKNIGQLLKYLSPYKSKIIIYFICVMLTVVFSLFSFAMIAPVLQVLFEDVDPNASTNTQSLVGQVSHFVNDFVLQFDKMTALMLAVIVVASATILKNLFLYLSLRILNPLRNTVIRELRDDLYSKTMSLPIGFFSEERKGDLVSKMTNDVNEVEVSIVSVIETVFREPITIVFTFGLMLYISVPMTLFMFIFLPIAGLIIGRVSKMLKKPSHEAQELLSKLMTNLDETILGMRVLKAFNAERYQQLKFREINNDYFRTKNKISTRRDAGSPMSETLGIIVACIIMLYGGYLIFNGKGDLTGSFFIAYIGLFYQLINPLKNLSNALFNIRKGSAALERIQDLLNTENTIQESAQAIKISDFKDKIEFRHVDFNYGEKSVLKDINLTISKGQTVALVGASGAGKSTMADLIPRFHDVSSGEILIDGINVKDLNLFAFRQLIGMVNQDPILFNDTIEANIKLGLGGKSYEEIVQAAQIANAHQFITLKEEGYQTNVGDRGMKLSGGERQRVTIARAVLKNPPILILDEATSALDTESEKHVQDAIYHLMQNRTSIVIAHRLSTIKNADMIVVLDKGKIVEQGTHAELMEKSEGHYKNLVSLQQLN